MVAGDVVEPGGQPGPVRGLIGHLVRVHHQQGLGDLGPTVSTELVQDAGHMGTHGSRTDQQDVGDLGVAAPCGKQGQHLAFARG
jgi:hypothetical protein